MSVPGKFVKFFIIVVLKKKTETAAFKYAEADTQKFPNDRTSCSEGFGEF